jgi:hypothetical protein
MAAPIVRNQIMPAARMPFPAAGERRQRVISGRVAYPLAAEPLAHCGEGRAGPGLLGCPLKVPVLPSFKRLPKLAADTDLDR